MDKAQDKLDRLRELLADANPQDKVQLDKWQSDLKRALLRKDLQDHDGVKMLLEYYVKQIKGINEILLKNRELDEVDRMFLFERRDWCQNFLDFFGRADVVEQVINDAIDGAIKKVK